jgi:hypothetical protein
LKVKNEPMPWEGDADKKPEIERCYSINIKEKLESGVVDMGHEWFCIFTNADNTEEIDPNAANLAVTGWVDKINEMCR